MANWAATSYAIDGPKEVLEKIYEAILHPEVKSGSSENWEGNVLNTLGAKWTDRGEDRQKGSYMRGFIQDDPWWQDESHTCLRFEAEEAWGATDLDEVLEANFPVKVWWITEEPGMEVFETNDKHGKYFSERFMVDTCINSNYQSDYFKTKEAAYQWLAKLTNGKIKNEQQVEAFNEADDTLEDDFIFVHEYRILD